MVAGGGCPCGEHRIIYRLAESLCCAPGAIVALRVNYTSFKTKQNINGIPDARVSVSASGAHGPAQ